MQFNLKSRRVGYTLLAVVVALFISRREVRAWWAGGHRIATLAAVSKLPAEVPAFFRSAGEQLAEMSVEPDNWKSPTTPHLRGSEAPEHYIDLEYLDGKGLPEQRFLLLKHYFDRGIDPAKGGFLPYALQEGYERLLLAFREHRSRPDSVAVQQRIIVYAGWLAHYCEDAGMPLHTTVNFDGKPGPDKAVVQKGIHARIDGYPETQKFTPELVAETLEAQHAVDVWPRITKAIQESHTHVERCYELDEDGAFGKAPDKGRELMLERTRASAKLTLDLWYSAWKNSDPARATIPPERK